MMLSLPTYDCYKDSGVDWLGEIPQTWELTSGRTCFAQQEIKNKGNQETTVLSLSYGNIVIKPEAKLDGLVPESFETYQIVDVGNIIIRSTDLQNDKTSLRVGLVKNKGIITSAYLCLVTNEKIKPEFAYYLLHAYDLLKVYYGMGSGLRQNLSFTDFKYLKLPLPPIEEQEKIVKFLDKKCEEVEKSIELKQRLIALLDEQKSIVINQAVTKGLNPNAPMKDSGIDWLGDIPAHWEVKKLKYVCKIFRGKFTHRPRNDPKLYDGKYPFVQTGDIARARKFLTTYNQTLNEKGLRVSTLIPKGTVLITIAANIGDITILNFDSCFPDSVVGFYPYQILKRDFLYYALVSMKQKFINSSIQNTQMNLNVERIGVNFILIPPIEEQEKIVEYLEEKTAEIEELKEKTLQQIEKLKELKQILIAEAVTGKIKV
ncbi:restriction endonuclease subunit S [Geminocystis sp.]|uniref:restriction endonuclease subunit S n=1 Tax=Geminocystis sp. TaxID=2664100 RepID=UPI0035933634